MRSSTLALVCATTAILLHTAAADAQTQEAPTDRAVVFPVQVLENLITIMEADGDSGNRLLEGGTHNVNIRHDESITPEEAVYRAHPNTVDVWVVKRGSGTLVTGGEYVNDVHVGGVEQVIGEGDIVFIPAGLLHGMKEARSITWMNIRYDMVE